ncbi:uncharacterized protein LOC129594756 [Paramacrobiotus metropolitanus]|uniref:uncharacterized protein LOC129594756 n=1 Tax=Paramacrobiotus metropolitanus TaxID=2943436 RepID=UPI002445F5B1|nr:uncharacterized protein LOC129594756 [Paramacrobiotus metropolitanus]
MRVPGRAANSAAIAYAVAVICGVCFPVNAGQLSKSELEIAQSRGNVVDPLDLVLPQTQVNTGLQGEFFSLTNDPWALSSTSTHTVENALKNESASNVTRIPGAVINQPIILLNDTRRADVNASTQPVHIRSNVTENSTSFLGYIDTKAFLADDSKKGKPTVETTPYTVITSNTSKTASGNGSTPENRPITNVTQLHNHAVALRVTGHNKSDNESSANITQTSNQTVVIKMAEKNGTISETSVAIVAQNRPIINATHLQNQTVALGIAWQSKSDNRPIINASQQLQNHTAAANLTGQNATLRPHDNATNIPKPVVQNRPITNATQFQNQTSPVQNISVVASVPLRNETATPRSTAPNRSMANTTFLPANATKAPRRYATRCKPAKCRLPNCRCGSTEIPGGLPADQTPQMILLTFDDAVTPATFEDYKVIFGKNWTNPNGCPIRGTFYVSDEWTKYNLVKTLYDDGHEIASHSINHRNPPENSTIEFWEKEINGQKEILNKSGHVPLEAIRGMRAPFLQIGGDLQFEMLADKGFLYDSSIITSISNPPMWPYTLDYAVPHMCLIPPCPVRSYPGLWEMPMVQWESDLWKVPCAMVDTCSLLAAPSAVATYDLLMKNFNRHFNSNRAPFGIYMHATWFLQRGRLKGLQDFLGAVMQYDDVWVITTYQALQWIQHPTSLSSMDTKEFPPWSCKR